MKINPTLNKIVRQYDTLPKSKLEKIQKLQVKEQEKALKNALKPSILDKISMNSFDIVGQQMNKKTPISVKKIIVSFSKLMQDKDLMKLYTNLEAQSKNLNQPLKVGQQTKAELRRITRKRPDINEHLKNIRDNLQNPKTQEFLSPLMSFSQKLVEQVQTKSTLNKLMGMFSPKPKVLKELNTFNLKAAEKISLDPIGATIEALNGIIKK